MNGAGQSLLGAPTPWANDRRAIEAAMGGCATVSDLEAAHEAPRRQKSGGEQQMLAIAVR